MTPTPPAVPTPHSDPNPDIRSCTADARPAKMPGGDPVQGLATFARTRVLTRPGLGRSGEFPRDLWEEMGRTGLLDPDRFAPAREGASRNRCRNLTRGARALAGEGGNLGLTLSWIIHHLTAHYILGSVLGSAGPDPGLVQALKTGAATLSFAVSEPGVGGHPKSLSTRAQRRGEDWEIRGEKTYLTNGPIARAFVVIAVSGQEGARKSFTAFLVDRETPGLTLLPPMEVPFLKPSPHGGIRLDNCRVGADRMVGQEGRAYPDLVLKFRQLEDALMTGAVSGAMGFLVKALGRQLTGRGEPDLCQRLGRLAAMAEAADLLSDQVADGAEPGQSHRAGAHLFFRELALGFVRDVEAFLAEFSVTLPPAAVILAQDLKASAGLGKTISGLRLQKLGQRLIPPEE